MTVGVSLRVRTDGAFVLRPDAVPLPPLPVIVAVVVDLLDRVLAVASCRRHGQVGLPGGVPPGLFVAGDVDDTGVDELVDGGVSFARGVSPERTFRCLYVSLPVTPG